MIGRNGPSRAQRWQIVSAALLIGWPLPGKLNAQETGAWFVSADAGRYEIHEGGASVGNAPAGVILAVSGGRRWGPLSLKLTLGQAFGDDTFTSLEPGIELAVPQEFPVGVIVGVGGGAMWEKSGTLSVPYYAMLGVEGRFIERIRFRAMVRRGAHANTGDSGTFRGPHTITVGVVWTK